MPAHELGSRRLRRHDLDAGRPDPASCRGRETLDGSENVTAEREDAHGFTPRGGFASDRDGNTKGPRTT